MARKHSSSLGIHQIIIPGTHAPGCLVCCSAPVCCPMCSILPCCDDADYVKEKREASKYIWVRENSLEWNEPRVIMRAGSCLGLDPCHYEIQDDVTVLFFDDPLFDRLVSLIVPFTLSSTHIDVDRSDETVQ